MKRFFKFCFKIFLLFGFLGTAIGGFVGAYYYRRLTRDLPQIEKLKDYRPAAVSSVYSSDGVLLAELFDENGKRYPVDFKDIPLVVRNAFLAAEDASFYSHPGIDLISILRALVKNVLDRGVKQGASTITQQTVKCLLLTREKSFERKAKEAILAYRLEKYLSKDEIFSIYLNEIYLGSGASGVKAAARVHFHKELNELSVAEAAFLARLPKAPSEYSDPNKRKEAIIGQHYVLKEMLENRMISKEQYDAALAEKLNIYRPDDQTIFAAPYFTSYVINESLPPILKKIDPYITAGNPGGYVINTSVNESASRLAQAALRRGLKEIDKRQGWRGPLEAKPSLILSEADLKAGEIYRAEIVGPAKEAGVLLVKLGAVEGQLNINSATWAKRLIKDSQVSGINPIKFLKPGDVVEATFKEPAQEASGQLPVFELDQTPELEGAFVLANVFSGEIVAMIGGYDYQRSKFNRVVLARRQPGSSFKPFVYLSALEYLGYTPSTIVHDSPISLPAGNGEMWTPGNFDGKFLGPITLRTALQKSRNVVSVQMVQELGVDRVIQTAHKMGISTEIPPNLSISLGSAEVKMLDLVRAYGVFASGGLLADEVAIKSIKDRDGRILYEAPGIARRVVDEDLAFIMANMMKGVVERGTATVLKQLGKPIAGKTGTTNDQMDAWFVGYTPEWVGGVWVGYDLKRSIGKLETGGKAAAPIMLYFLQDFLAKSAAIDFPLSENVIPVPIDLESGHPVSPSSPSAFTEYFKAGTEPALAKPSTEEEELEPEEEEDAETEVLQEGSGAAQ